MALSADANSCNAIRFVVYTLSGQNSLKKAISNSLSCALFSSSCIFRILFAANFAFLVAGASLGLLLGAVSTSSSTFGFGFGSLEPKPRLLFLTRVSTGSNRPCSCAPRPVPSFHPDFFSSWKPMLEEPMDDIASLTGRTRRSSASARRALHRLSLLSSFQASRAPLWFYLPVWSPSHGSLAPCRVRLGHADSRVGSDPLDHKRPSRIGRPNRRTRLTYNPIPQRPRPRPTNPSSQSTPPPTTQRCRSS